MLRQLLLVCVIGSSLVATAWAYPPPSLVAEMQPPRPMDYYRLWEVRNLSGRTYEPGPGHGHAHKPLPCPPAPVPDPLIIESSLEWGVGLPTDCGQFGKYPKHGRVGPYGTFMPGSYYIEEPKIIMPMPAFGPAF